MNLPELKVTCTAERQNGDRWVIAQFRLVIGMPSHRILPGSIIIKQCAIGVEAGHMRQATEHLHEAIWPTLAPVKLTTIGIINTFFRQPAFQPGNCVLFTVKGDFTGLPVDRLLAVVKKRV